MRRTRAAQDTRTMTNSVLYKAENSQSRNNEPGTRLICHWELRNPHTLSWLDYQAMGDAHGRSLRCTCAASFPGPRNPFQRNSMQNELKSRIFIIFGQTLG